MFLRRIVVPAAALAIGAAFVPFSASAVTPHQSRQLPAQRSSTLVSTPTSSTFKTFTSPASKSVRLQKAATTSVKSRTSAAGTTIYANPYSFASCTDGAGAGSQATPYCTLQLAVNAARPGDTVAVLSSSGYFDEAPLTVTTSGISIVGVGGNAAWLEPANLNPVGTIAPALLLKGVSNVTVSNLILTSYDSGSPVVIQGSTGVTLDSDYIASSSFVAPASLVVDGSSSNVTVSRTYVNDPAGSAISIESGASNVTLAGDVLAASGVVATGVSGLNLAGNTIQRGCASAIDVEGSSTGVHVENNLLEDANPTTDYSLDGTASWCASTNRTWAPDLTVSAQSSAGTTADYNDFYVYGSDATAPYSWAGTSYPTLAAFQSGAGQGAHDTMEAKQPWSVNGLRPNQGSYVDMTLAKDSTAIGTANTSAPGELSSDFFGISPYTSRGAVQYVPYNPNFAVALEADATSARGFAFTPHITSTNVKIFIHVVWGDGSTTDASGYGNVGWWSPHTYSKLGTYTISVTVTDDENDTVGNSVTVTTAGSDYTAYGPQRILDTRKGIGTGGAVAKVGASSTLKLQVTGAGSAQSPIPSGATAVVLNLTVTNPAANGYLTAYPNEDPSGAAQSRPTSSNVNFSTGQTVPNLAIVPLGKDGIVDLYNGSGGGVDVIADVTGYFTRSASSGYTALTPARLVDTRKGIGATQAQVPANGSITAQVAGADGGQLPSSGVTAVALNVTSVNAHAGGYLTVYPDGGNRPTASNLNFSAGQVIANAVIVPVGADGEIDVFNGSGGGADVIIDVVGFYSSAGASAYLPVAPTRVLDTRSAGAGPLQPGGYAILYSQASVSNPALTAYVFNTTVANTNGAGYETVAPDPNTLSAYQNGTAVFPTPPTVSTLNWNQGQVVPNLVQAGTGQNGIIDVWNRSGGTADLVVDEFGFYQAD